MAKKSLYIYIAILVTALIIGYVIFEFFQLPIHPRAPQSQQVVALVENTSNTIVWYGTSSIGILIAPKVPNTHTVYCNLIGESVAGFAHCDGYVVNFVNSSSTTIPGTAHVISNSTPANYTAVKILSVMPNNLTIGSKLGFNITFENLGAVPIYYHGGCVASPISFNVTPPSALTSHSGPTCLAISLNQVAPNQTTSLYYGGVGGTSYTIAKSVNATVNFTMEWWTDSNVSGPVHMLNFSRQYKFVS